MLLHRHGILCCGCGGSAAVVGRGAFADQSGAKDTSARRLSWAQVEAMTGGFTSAVVGEGGFSTVYLARLAGSLAAVKVIHRGSERLRRAFRQELDALLRVRHPHIVRLLGFCDQRDEGVLVLEFAPNGSLHDRLHGGGKGGKGYASMPWSRRVSVARQVARALEYLHDRCDPQVVHGDVKASNVVLDAAMGARLCDFGSSARAAGFPLSPSSAAAVRPRPSALAVFGSPGYVDPHYLRSGVVAKSSDVYGFGVLMLELVTGTQAFRDGRLLTAAVTAPKINALGSRDLGKLVDRRLGSRYVPDEAAVMLALAAACVGDNPSLRPSMADVVRTLEQNGQASIVSTVGTIPEGDEKLVYP